MLRRRELLWSLAAGASYLGGGVARAEAGSGSAAVGETSLRRFIGVYTPHGMAAEYWRPGPNFDLRFPGCSLRPFDAPETYGRSFRDRLLVLEGIDLAAGITVGTTGHDAARVILTGSGADARGPSIDQYLAIDAQLGLDTPLSTVVLGVGHDESDIGWNLSYDRSGTPIPKVIDPAQTFADLFGGPLRGASAEELARERRRGSSALDVLRGELARLRREAPTAERIKIEQHHDALREIEKQLLGFERACPEPGSPSPIGSVRAFGGEANFERITDLQIDLLTRAMACDLTRFATLFLADLTRTNQVADLPLDIHNDVAHRYDSPGRDRPGTPSTWLPLARQNEHSYAQVARLVRGLDDAGLLDETLVYVSSDMGDPARHSSRDVPTLLIGGGPFAMGRHIDVKATNARTTRGFVPNNRVLVSVCQSFGVHVNQFGHSSDPEIAVGELIT